MTEPGIHPVAASASAKDQAIARESQKMLKRDWWLWGYSIFVFLLVVFAVTAFSLPAVRTGAETIFKVKMVDVVFGLIALVVLFNVYAVSQAILIRRLRRQLAEKQGHSDLLRNLAMVDPLTGLYNRRFAEQRLAAEVARSERKGHPLTILTLDLNNFKEINDTYGHPAGDLVLQKFAAHLNDVIRGGDLAVRLGGDEFLVLLPECTSQQLQLVLGRLGSLQVDWNGKQIPITFSAGWKQYELGERPEEMLASADKVLYDRKRAGKITQPPADGRHQSPKQRAQRQTQPESLNVLVDLICPHCRKKNSVALDTQSGTSNAAPREVQCAHCKQSWEPLLSGPILAGPFPK
jgi:diguanylate cyclase (GGDEF)-like protein